MVNALGGARPSLAKAIPIIRNVSHPCLQACIKKTEAFPLMRTDGFLGLNVKVHF